MPTEYALYTYDRILVRSGGIYSIANQFLAAIAAQNSQSVFDIVKFSSNYTNVVIHTNIIGNKFDSLYIFGNGFKKIISL